MRAEVGGYSPKMAYVMAQASAWAYSDLSTHVSRMSDVGFEVSLAEHFEVDNSALFLNTHAVWLEDSRAEVAILAFRGTEFANGHYIDLLTDASIEPIRYKGQCNACVHAGFYHNLAAVWPRILDTLYARMSSVKHIYVTGHSLGGALAALAVAEVLLDDGDKHQALYADFQRRFQGLYTFGQPMIGDRSFVAACQAVLGDRCFRHIYKADLVPQLPPKSTGNFVHFGQEYRINRRGEWYPSRKQMQQVYTLMLSLPVAGFAFIARQFVWGRQLPFSVSLADHSPLYYLEASKKSLT